MKILIDFTQIPKEKVGVGVYALQTFKRIIAKDKENCYYFVVQNDDVEFQSICADNLNIVLVKSNLFRHFILRLLLEHLYLPFLILKYKIDVVHSLHYSFPLVSFGAKRVVTLHDMTFYLYPYLHTRIKRYYFRFFIWLSTRYVNKIISVSESTKSDLISQFPQINMTKVVSIPLACEYPVNIRKRVSYKKPYIAFIGTLEPRKNVSRLIEAFAKVVSDERFSQYSLLIVGKKGWYYQSIFDTVKRLNLSDKILFPGFVTDEEKFSILNSASLFVYPSLYEGFGLPVLEALSLGVPTITSNVSSMPEVAGEAAKLINPNSVDELQYAMTEILSSLQLQTQMKIWGVAQSKFFSWENTANKTIDLYNSLK